MKKNNKLIPYEEHKVTIYKKKIPKKNILLVLVIIAFLISVILISVELFNPSVRLKKELVSNKWKCNELICTTEENSIKYTVNYKEFIYYYENNTYSVTISKETPILVIKKDGYVCNYTKDDYKPFTPIDKTFDYDQKCSKYVGEVNDKIKDIRSSFDELKIDVNKIGK